MRKKYHCIKKVKVCLIRRLSVSVAAGAFVWSSNWSVSKTESDIKCQDLIKRSTFTILLSKRFYRMRSSTWSLCSHATLNLAIWKIKASAYEMDMNGLSCFMCAIYFMGKTNLDNPYSWQWYVFHWFWSNKCMCTLFGCVVSVEGNSGLKNSFKIS